MNICVCHYRKYYNNSLGVKNMNVYLYQFTLKSKNLNLIDFMDSITKHPDGFHRLVNGKRRELFLSKKKKKKKHIFYGLIITRTGKNRIPSQDASGSFKSQKLKYPEIGFNLFIYDTLKKKGIYTNCTGTLRINASNFLWLRMLSEYDMKVSKEQGIKLKDRPEKDKPSISCEQIYSESSLKDLALKFKKLKKITLKNCVLVGNKKSIFIPTKERPFDYSFPVLEHDNISDLIDDIEQIEDYDYSEVVATGKTKDNTDKTFYSKNDKNFEYLDILDHDRFIELMESYDPKNYIESKIFKELKKHL